MVDEDLDREEEEQEEEGGEKKARGPRFVKILIITLFVLAVLGGGGGAAYFLLVDQPTEGQIADSKETAKDAKGKEGKEKKEKKKKKKKKKKGKKDKKKKDKTPKVEIFFPMDPPLVVNFTNPRPVRFLQIQMEVLVHSEEAVENIKKYMPIIRNNLVIMLSGLDSQSLNSREGKEKVRADILAEIKAILKERTGEAEVEQVYFTGFVMQ